MTRTSRGRGRTRFLAAAETAARTADLKGLLQDVTMFLAAAETAARTADLTGLLQDLTMFLAAAETAARTADATPRIPSASSNSTLHLG
jgi:hypothetical protein